MLYRTITTDQPLDTAALQAELRRAGIPILDAQYNPARRALDLTFDQAALDDQMYRQTDAVLAAHTVVPQPDDLPPYCPGCGVYGVTWHDQGQRGTYRAYQCSSCQSFTMLYTKGV